MVRLNAQGWNVPAIVKIFDCQEQTVRGTLRRWEQGGLGGLWDAPGRGAKPKWNEEDMAFVECCLDQEQRTYNSVQLAAKLEEERQIKRQIKLSADRIHRILQKGLPVETDSPLATAPARPRAAPTQTS